MTTIIDGKALSEKILQECKAKLIKSNRKPELTVVQVGNNPESSIYVNRKQKIAQEIGINSVVKRFPETASEKEVLEFINILNNENTTDAILVQLPLPEHISESKIINAIKSQKDVDGFTNYNISAIAQSVVPLVYPCTPAGIIKILDEYNIEIEGKHAVVVGRSNIVGRPLALMLLNRNATVTICHSKTKNLSEITQTADILIAATGNPKFINTDMIKNGACVIDVGIKRLPNGKISGDVDFEGVKEKTSYITPVPGGVGPMTIAMLMYNTIKLFENNHNL